jgi:hypothetical protein
MTLALALASILAWPTVVLVVILILRPRRKH